jgi:hypothetical protein
MSQDEIPSVKEELERKTVDLLEHHVGRVDSNRMSQDDLNMVAQALWNVTSGLVSQEVSDLCAAAANAAKPRKLTRSYVGKGGVMTVAWFPDTAGYVIFARNATSLVKTSKVVKTEIGPREVELTALFETLTKSGYTQL